MSCGLCSTEQEKEKLNSWSIDCLPLSKTKYYMGTTGDLNISKRKLQFILVT